MSEVKKTKVMFLSPHAGIWAHALPESFVAKCLNRETFDVVRVACDGTFHEHCTVMSAANVGIERSADEKAALCRVCIANTTVTSPSYGPYSYFISGYLSAEDYALVARMVDGLNESNIQDLVFEGIDVARIASYEILIKFKKTTLDFSGVEFDYLRVYVRNSMLSLLAFKNVYELLRPDVLIAYSPQYGVNGVCARYCETKGIPVFFIEGSANFYERYQALRIWNWTVFGLTNPALRYWNNVGQYLLSDEDKSRVLKHTETLLKANSFSVYSAPASNKGGLRDRFGVPQGSRVLLVAMSSYDEVFSAFVINRFPRNKYVSDVFADQLEWVQYTVKFVAEHNDLFLIIRIHPRTFPSKRNSVLAAEQLQLAKLLKNLPPNVRVNYPEDNISIYDLYKEVDALVTGWSATGIEAMTFGLPVVTYDSNLPSYPASIHHTGRSRTEYEANLLKAAVAGKSQKHVSDAHHWMAFSMSRGVVRHPPLFRFAYITSRFKMLRFAVRAFEMLLPVVVKRLELRRSMSSADDVRKINSLLQNRGSSLYDV